MAHCGIYKIQSKIKPERIYIGSSVDIYNRWRLHKKRLEINKSHSPKLQNHYNKYGREDLDYSIIIECNRGELLDHEQFFIDVYNPFFNICKVAGNHLGRKCSKESIERMRIAKSNISQETRKRISESAHNRICVVKRVLSEETKEKIRQKAMGNKRNVGRKWTKEQRIKFINSRKGKSGRSGFSVSEETKEKMRIAKKGKIMSQETRLKISIAKKGKKLKPRKAA
jgi:group I intron endonuclease